MKKYILPFIIFFFPIFSLAQKDSLQYEFFAGANTGLLSGKFFAPVQGPYGGNVNHFSPGYGFTAGAAIRFHAKKNPGQVFRMGIFISRLQSMLHYDTEWQGSNGTNKTYDYVLHSDRFRYDKTWFSVSGEALFFSANKRYWLGIGPRALVAVSDRSSWSYRVETTEHHTYNNLTPVTDDDYVTNPFNDNLDLALSVTPGMQLGRVKNYPLNAELSLCYGFGKLSQTFGFRQMFAEIRLSFLLQK